MTPVDAGSAPIASSTKRKLSSLRSCTRSVIDCPLGRICIPQSSDTAARVT